MRRENSRCARSASARSRAWSSRPRLEQIRRQIGPANVDAEALDDAASFDDGAAGLPERAPLTQARLGLARGDETKRAVLGFDLAHNPSLRGDEPSGIGRGTDSLAAFY